MNSKWHLYISIIKSILRLIGCVVAIAISPFFAISILAFFLGVAEILGIMEEIGDKR